VSGAAAFSRPKIEVFQKRDGGPRGTPSLTYHASRTATLSVAADDVPFPPDSGEAEFYLIMIDLACGPSFGTLRERRRKLLEPVQSDRELALLVFLAADHREACLSEKR